MQTSPGPEFADLDPTVSEQPMLARDDARTRREIRSFVRRSGRITPGQKRALHTHWSRYGIDFTGTPRDLSALFCNDHPVVLEIGFGNGEALLAAALSDPQRNYLGIEVHEPGIGRLLRDAASAKVCNLRICKHDAVEILRHEIPPGSLSEVRLYFPDPWPKKRHHKRRLVQPPFVELVASRLAVGGLFHLATDWEPYAEQMFDVIEASPWFENVIGPRQAAPRPPWRIETHFEKRGRRLGHGVWDLLYRRRHRSDDSLT